MNKETDVAVVALPGPRIHNDVTQNVRSEIASYLDNGRFRLVLDASRVEFVDSMFLGMLVVALKRATAGGGDVKLCGLQKSVQAIFQLMRLHRVFELYETREAAIAAFK